MNLPTIPPGASVRVRAAGTADQLRTLDQRTLRAALHAAGAVRVNFDLKPVREDRARVEGLSAAILPGEALARWATHNALAPDLHVRMDEWLRAALAEVGSEGATLGGGYRPVRTEATNYGRYQHVQVDWPSGCVAVVGPNGAGKSTLLNLLDLSVFAGRGELADHRTRGQDDPLEIAHEFESGGDLYRVRRTYRAGARGKQTLDLERAAHPYVEDAGHSWMPLTRESAQETQALIEQTLGLTRATFRHSAFGAQHGRSFADPALGAAERKALLFEAVVAPVWAVLADRARAERKANADALLRLDGEADQLRAIMLTAGDAKAALAQAASVLTQAHLEATTADQQHTTLASRYEDAKTMADKLAAARHVEQAAADRLQRLRTVQRDGQQAAVMLEDLDADLRRLHPLVEELPALDLAEAAYRQKTEEHARAVAEYKAARSAHELKLLQRNAIIGNSCELNEKAHELREEAAALEQRGPGEAHCDRCQQTLGAEALASALASMRAEADDLDAAAKDLDAQAAAIALPAIPATPGDPPARDEKLAERIARARDAATEIRVLTERRTGLAAKTAAAETEEFLQQLAAAEHDLLQANETVVNLEADTLDADAVAALAADVDAAAHARDTARQAVTDATAAKARAEERAERVREAEQALAETDRRRATLVQTGELLAAVERACGRDGIPALLLEATAIPEIEAHTNEYLARLPMEDGRTFRVELHTQAALKSGDGLRETLDVVVYDELGEPGPFETFSGGEATRIGLALRLALSRLLATRRGAELPFLVLDEPEALDATGMAALLDLLRDLSRTVFTAGVYLISHVPQLREAFDETLVVELADGVSRLAADREAVIA